MDFIFGSFAEWMGVLDNRPGSTHCSLSPAEWKLALSAAGYDNPLLLTSSGSSVAHLAFISQSTLSLAAERNASSVPVPASSSSSLLQSSIAESVTSPNANIKLDIAEITMDLTDARYKPEAMGIPSCALLEGSGLNDSLTVVHPFSAGGEINLVQFLSGLDPMKPHVVWLYTDTEEENSTLIGLVRSIRHEFTCWKVMTVLFHPLWDQSQQKCFIYRRLMSLKWVDAEVLVDEEGGMHVPRIVTAPAPPRTEARENKPVEFDQSRIWRGFPVPLGPEDVEITVAFMSLSPAFAGCSEFSGQVTAVGSNVPNGSFLGKRHVRLSSCPVMLTCFSPLVEFLVSVLQSREMLLSAIVPRLPLFHRVCTSRRLLQLPVVSVSFPPSLPGQSLQPLSKHHVSFCMPAILLPPPSRLMLTSKLILWMS
jgi:fatty acid synthase, animal type